MLTGRHSRRSSRQVAWLLSGLLLAGCGANAPVQGGEPGGGEVVLVATTTILGDVVTRIVGEDATVVVLMPAGADPHSFEASAQQAAQMRDAALVIANGGGLEAGIRATLDAAERDGTEVLEVLDLVDALPVSEPAQHAEADGDEHGDEHSHGERDPHFWHDPLRMAVAIDGILDAIISAAPQLDSAELRQRAEGLVAELEALDGEIQQILEVVPTERRYLVTNHDSLGYLAARYGFEIVGTVIPGTDTLAAPAAAELAELADMVRDLGLPAVFAEETVATNLVDALAREVGTEVEVVSLFTGSLGGPGSGAETYTGMLRTNAHLLADALG